jgi:hypothetical protein
MRITDACRVVLVAAGAGIAVASSLATAKAATGRNAAMHRCMAKARASTDVNLGAVHNQRRQTAIYRMCMEQAGFRP